MRRLLPTAKTTMLPANNARPQKCLQPPLLDDVRFEATPARTWTTDSGRL